MHKSNCRCASPDFIPRSSKPNTIVQDFTLTDDAHWLIWHGLVYGIDEDGEWYFNGSGKRPEELKKEEASRLAPPTPPRRRRRARAAR